MAIVLTPVEITNTGATLTYDPSTWGGGDAILYLYTTTSFSLGGNISVTLSSDLNLGANFTLILATQSITRNGHSLLVVLPTGGYNYTENWQFLTSSMCVVTAIGASTYSTNVIWDLATGNGVGGTQALSDYSTPLSKLSKGTSAYYIVCDSSGIPTYVAMSGGGTITNAGVFALSAGYITNSMINASAAIAVNKLAALTATKLVTTDASGFITTSGAGVIVNADVNASAAIAVSKLAALTASKVVVTDGSGVLTTANQLSPLLGGNGIDNSAATGFPIWTAGTQSVGAISEIITLQVSFESGYLGDFKILMPYAGTVTGIYAYATKVIAGTDNGTIVAKNNGGTTMTNGTITYTASDARGTAYSVSPSANNTFADGDLLTFTTAKTTAGGVVQLSIKITRTS